MNRLLGQSFAVVVLGTLITAFSPACAENDQSIFIRQALAPAQNRQNGACTYTSDPTQPALSEGLVDVAIRDTYVAALLVGNQLVPRADAQNTRVEPNRAHLNGAVVRVTDPSGAELGEFTSLGSSFIEPQQNNLPSFSPLFVTALDASISAKLLQQVPPGKPGMVVANIKVFGRTVGGVDIESGEFQYPIRVCNGCLVSFASGDDPATQGIDCNLPLAENAGGQQLPCAPGQDEVTPCQLCSDRQACRTR
jgi:hypothetical protein